MQVGAIPVRAIHFTTAVRPATSGEVNVRLLLTNRCSARCGYCHNEGQQQGRDFLSPERIASVLDRLAATGRNPGEVTLSGGEPTLHPQLAEIARLCKGRGFRLSMASHGGHPGRLARVLTCLDELKLHIDSFDADEQQQCMGIKLEKSLQSLRLAQARGVAVCVNHPLRDAEQARRFLQGARTVGVDCKIVEMHGQQDAVLLDEMDWAEMGYRRHATGEWLHDDGRHRLYTKRCGSQHNRQETWFVDHAGIRSALDGPMVEIAEL